jgi:hypothetical protein
LGEKPEEGAIAHLVERLPCTQEVVGSSPTGSTKRWSREGERSKDEESEKVEILNI